MTKDDLRAVRARKFVIAAHRRLKSWQKVADRYGLANKTRAYMIAKGKLKPNPVCDAVLLSDMEMARPTKLRRFIRKVAVPFFHSRQPSPSHVYAHGGRRLSWEE